MGVRLGVCVGDFCSMWLLNLLSTFSIVKMMASLMAVKASVKTLIERLINAVF